MLNKLSFQNKFEIKFIKNTKLYFHFLVHTVITVVMEEIKKKSRLIQWDEEVIAEHDKERGTRYFVLLSSKCLSLIVFLFEGKKLMNLIRHFNTLQTKMQTLIMNLVLNLDITIKKHLLLRHLRLIACAILGKKFKQN